jgi:hypothetical protein
MTIRPEEILSVCTCMAYVTPCGVHSNYGIINAYKIILLDIPIRIMTAPLIRSPLLKRKNDLIKR